MNRRSFLSGILKAGVAAAFLPPALTYARHWKQQGQIWCIDEIMVYRDALPYRIYEVKELRTGFACSISSSDDLPNKLIIKTARWADTVWTKYPENNPDHCPLDGRKRVSATFGNIQTHKGVAFHYEPKIVPNRNA